MKMLAEDGWRLVRQGDTTVEEVLSVTTAKEVARSTAAAGVPIGRIAETASCPSMLRLPCIAS